MSLLDRIALIRRLSGTEAEDCLGQQEEAVTFFPEQHTRFGIVSNLRVARGLLNSRTALAIDHVSVFIEDLPEQEADYVRFFLSHSPEFLNGEVHSQAAASMRDTIARLLPVAEALDPEALAQQVMTPLNREPAVTLSSKRLAATVLAACVSRVFAAGFNAAEGLFQADQFIENSGVFNAIPRASKLRLLNSRLEALAARTDWHQRDPGARLLILVISLMGTMPLLATLTASVHRLLELGYGNPGAPQELPDDLQGNGPFDRVLPVRFVLRRMASAARIEGIDFEAGDVLFVYLGEGNGCPIRRFGALPFGSGLHHCPGAALSRVITAKALRTVLLTGLLSRTVPTPKRQGHVDAFLGYEG